METIIFKRICGGWMFSLLGDSSSAIRYFDYPKREAYRIFKKKYGIKRAHLVEDTCSFSYGYLY